MRANVLAALGLVALCIASTATAQEVPVFVLEFGSYGSGPGEFISPHGVAVDPIGFVYVTDPVNGRVLKFTSSGEFVTMWGTPGSGPGEFGGIIGIAADTQGKVYVAEYSRLQVFTSTGEFVREWGTAGFGPGQFQALRDVAIGVDGFVYTVETGNQRVQKFTPSGECVGIIGAGLNMDAVSVAVDYAGFVYVAHDKGHGLVKKFDPGGQFIAEWGGPGSGPGQLGGGPVGLAIDFDGSVLVVEHLHNRVQRFTAGGAFLSQWGSTGTGPGLFAQAADVAVDGRGAIYVLDMSAHRVQKFEHLPVVTRAASWGSVKSRYR